VTPRAANAAFQQQQGNGVYAVLSQFVTNVESASTAATVSNRRSEFLGRQRCWSHCS
jgi:hypothetical protein